MTGLEFLPRFPLPANPLALFGVLLLAGAHGSPLIALAGRRVLSVNGRASVAGLLHFRFRRPFDGRGLANAGLPGRRRRCRRSFPVLLACVFKLGAHARQRFRMVALKKID